jgi:hypothetical protein
MTKPAPTIDDVIYAIRAYAHQQGWTMYAIAKRARIQPTTLRDFHKLKWTPNAATLRILRSLVPDDFDPAKAKPPPVLEDDDDGEGPQESRQPGNGREREPGNLSGALRRDHGEAAAQEGGGQRFSDRVQKR